MSDQGPQLTIVERAIKSLWDRWMEKRFTESDWERRLRIQEQLRERPEYHGIRRDIFD